MSNLIKVVLIPFLLLDRAIKKGILNKTVKGLKSDIFPRSNSMSHILSILVIL